MLSIVIFTKNSAETLPLTLAPLVPAVIDGLLRRVIIVDSGSTDQTIQIAESMGCTVVDEADASAVTKFIPSQWVLVLQPGTIVPDFWEDSVRNYVESESQAARFSILSERKGWLGRLFRKHVGLEAGLLAPIDMLKPFLISSDHMRQAPLALKPQRLDLLVHNEKGEA